MSGWTFLMFGLIICVVDFYIGLRFTRMTGEQLERRPGGAAQSPEGLRRLGRALMISAPLFLLLIAAFCFGLFGPVDGIETIRFN